MIALACSGICFPLAPGSGQKTRPQSEGPRAHFSLPVTLVEELQCAGQGKAVRKLQGKRLGQLQPLPQTLRAWALLQLDGTPRVCRAASARLASAARNKSFREKVWREDGKGQPPGHMCEFWGSRFSQKNTKE